MIGAALFSSSPAHAVNHILQPQFVTTNLVSGEVNEALTFDVGRLIDQSGLVTSYNDRDGLFALNDDRFGHTTSSSPDSSRSWLSAEGVTSGVLTFDLGEEFHIFQLGLWNITGNQGVRGFQVLADNDADFDNGTRLELINRSTRGQSSGNTVRVERYSLTPTTSRYVDLNILSNYDGNAVALAEIPFEFSNLPGMAFLVAVGGLAYFRNKKGGTPAG